MQAEVITHKTPARLVLAAQGEGLYRDIAHFIEQGFATHYHANIHVSMPQLLAVTQSGQYRAALGLRMGPDTFFSQQYLTQPIMQTLAQHDIFTHANRLVEIGSLYSNSHLRTVQLLVSLVQRLKAQNITHILCTATTPLTQLFQSTGVNIVTLSQASADKLGAAGANWGDYYSTHPRVIVLSVMELAHLLTTPDYQRLVNLTRVGLCA